MVLRRRIDLQHKHDLLSHGKASAAEKLEENNFVSLESDCSSMMMCMNSQREVSIKATKKCTEKGASWASNLNIIYEYPESIVLIR